MQAATDGNEECGTNATTDGDELDLTIVQATLEVVGVLRDLAILDVDDVVAVVSVWRMRNILLLRRTFLPERHGDRSCPRRSEAFEGVEGRLVMERYDTEEGGEKTQAKAKARVSNEDQR